MRYLRLKNFERFQHYKDRKPTWVKLYRDLWLDKDFLPLSEHAKLLLIGMFTLASLEGNQIPDNPTVISTQLGLSRRGFKTKSLIQSLIAAGFLIVDASEPVHLARAREISVSSLPSSLPPKEEVQEEETKQQDDGFTPQDLVEGWNEICAPVGLPKVRELSRSRKAKIRDRLKEHPDQEFWDVAMQRVSESPLCLGEVSGWKANIDWLVKNDMNAVKAFEGNYAAKKNYQNHR